MYDLIIIGAGTAGISAYKEAVKYTQNILIVNDGPWDTTCARVGCMPSKVLISSANRMYDSQHINQVGISVESSFDTSHVMSHVRALRDRFTTATIKDVQSWPKNHRLSGKATFMNSDTIEVNGKHYQAKSFILAVGSRPATNQEWKDLLKEKFITSDEIFELKKLPCSLAVVGSGVIAIELAQAFSRLGVKTAIFARSKRIGILTSPNLQQLAQQQLSKELNIYFETLPNSVKLTDHQVELNFKHDGTEQTKKFDYLLNATGRSSLLDSLNLNKIDQQFSDVKKLPIHPETKQLGKLPIFIAGDAYTDTPLQHEAAHEGRKLVYNCLHYPKTKNVKNLTPLGIVFCSPEMAIAGQSYRQLQDKNIDFVTGYVSYEKQGRALVLGKNRGGAEVYFDKKTQKLLGAELFVHSAEHLAHLLCWMIQQEITLDKILEQPYYHPTLEEGLRTAFKHARRQIKSN
ncbi:MULTISPECIES: dihydrolipoyl dehydrogenase [Acinetobacter]|uniref:dihydrolipoyl dehydrogenase n=1 Tax=Acinetobacter TaxID=469 RepID=UPI0004533068|nr:MULTISPECIES: dihydrolipoyl dehydrogenase [Acinetobacter]ECE6726133.1 dihydrolipoyl dehydrogenase [Salmonella enterica subsp. enterica serovar Paratyphi A]EXD34604.1 pyridine nucleotide-disulfide oxidoreductase family protein [Acinetobacter sp. 479375]MCH2016598.1 dihydrolipoyl dehydrogenase [Acinetobacter ursingii]MCU4524937.1 dihydrolipoyl dehydrogenase [Acinetobacter ursingii]MCU4590040.1 dihydrolipoyl dehydrogenase [Acinetobacter ursingii]